MAVGSRLISLFTLSSLAVLICSLNASPVTALEISHSNNNARSLHNRGHDALAKRKRSTTKKSKRCRPKAAPPASSSKPADSKTQQPKPKPSQSNKNGGSGGGNNATFGGGHVDGHSGAGKTCLAWPNGEQWLDKWSGVKTMYTWSPACPSNAQSLGITCCPMLWGWNQLGQWNDLVGKGTPPCAMGPNEPEIPGQSNMSPESGIELWNKYIRPLKQKGVKLYSPATTSDPGGKKWMQTFFAKCGGDDKCGVDILAVHYYDVSPEGMIEYLKDLHDTFHLDIAVTEFACQNFNHGAQCDEGQVWNFQQKVTTFMEATPWIVKYCPWGAMQNLQGVNEDNKMMSGDGGINALGKAYLGL